MSARVDRPIRGTRKRNNIKSADETCVHLGYQITRSYIQISVHTAHGRWRSCCAPPFVIENHPTFAVFKKIICQTRLKNLYKHTPRTTPSLACPPPGEVPVRFSRGYESTLFSFYYPFAREPVLVARLGNILLQKIIKFANKYIRFFRYFTFEADES